MAIIMPYTALLLNVSKLIYNCLFLQTCIFYFNGFSWQNRILKSLIIVLNVDFIAKTWDYRWETNDLQMRQIIQEKISQRNRNMAWMESWLTNADLQQLHGEKQHPIY